MPKGSKTQSQSEVGGRSYPYIEVGDGDGDGGGVGRGCSLTRACLLAEFLIQNMSRQ